MRLNILFGGKQGQGVNVASSISAEMIADMGYHVFKYRDYGSLIQGGHAFDVLSVSDEPVRSHESTVDIVLALDENTVEEHEEDLAEDATVFKAWESIDEEDRGKSYNMIVVGYLAKSLGIDEDTLEENVRKEFEDQEEKVVEEDIRVAKKGYELAGNIEELQRQDRNLEILSGSEGIARGAVDSGLDVYLAYPMTPATPVLHELAGMQEEENMLTFQPENELAVVNAALGSAHTGAKTMVGTSGGGYDLMQEAMAMQGVSEIPLVVYLSQRAGVGTGIPTYSAQGDLDVAVKGSHSEFPRVVIAPGDAKET
ncbi:MAG: 2-oxoacid:acceptor oxidoreductase family protein, partial [Candidatus Aenigmatarchaeota archaeon]